jgi:hypothetical protein
MHTKLGQLLGHLSSTVGKRESLFWNLSYLKVKCPLSQRFDFPFGSYSLDIRKALRSTIRSELISDTNLKNAVSWSEVSKFTFSLGVSRLYDPKGKSKRCDSDLNRFRVKLATCKDSSLIRLPPCEATFKQHVLRTSLQKIWKNAHEEISLISH